MSTLLTSIDSEFPLREDLIHLNHAAVGPWPQRTTEAVCRFAEENTRQGSKRYLQWLEVEDHLREQIRDLINAPSQDDIALLKNTSEALSVVAFGLPWQAGDNIVISNEEFPSNRVVWQALEPQGVSVRQAPLHQAESPEAALMAAADEKTRLMSISSIQYASGLRLDLETLGRFCRERGILFCVDAIQSIGAVKMDVQAINADFVMADGHKWMLGPEGLALFYCRRELRDKLKLQQYGWHMTKSYTHFDEDDNSPADTARRFECGSPNMLGIHALSASLSLLQEVGMENIEDRVLDNSRLLFQLIAEQNKLELLSDSRERRFGGIVTFRHTTVSNDKLFSHLSDNNVLCAVRGGGIRFSPHFYTPKEKIERAIELVAQVI
jgi:cysteine desulfurase/selenocysteine lyase